MAAATLGQPTLGFVQPVPHEAIRPVGSSERAESFEYRSEQICNSVDGHLDFSGERTKMLS